MGYLTGRTNISGSNNTILGSKAEVGQSNLNNATAIGYNARVAVSNAIVLGDPTNTSLNVGIGTDSPQFPLDVRGIINLRNRGTIKFSHLSNPNLHNGGTDQFLTVNEQGETVLAHYRLTVRNAGDWSDKVFNANLSAMAIGFGCCLYQSTRAFTGRTIGNTGCTRRGRIEQVECYIIGEDRGIDALYHSVGEIQSTATGRH